MPKDMQFEAYKDLFYAMRKNEDVKNRILYKAKKMGGITLDNLCELQNYKQVRNRRIHKGKWKPAQNNRPLADAKEALRLATSTEPAREEFKRSITKVFDYLYP